MDTNGHPALVRAGDSLRIATVPTPSPGAGGILIAPSFVGVCGTDLQILNGSRPDTAEILGHEGGGVVVAAGPGAALAVGQRIVCNPSAQLPRGRIVGHNVSGLFQQYVVIDAQAVDDGVVQLVEGELPTICAALVEPLAGVIYTHELISRVVADLQSVVIFGAGPFGLMTALYLREQGVRALLIHSSQARLNTAIALGLIEPDSAMVVSPDLSARVLTWNAGQPLDAAVVSTSMVGAASVLVHAVQVLRNGGCIEMVTNFPASSPTPEGISAASLKAVRAANICGVPADGEYVFADIAGRRLAFTSHRGTSRSHLSRAMQALNSPTQRYTALITHVLSLRAASDAIVVLSRSRGAFLEGRDCIKAVVDLTSLPGLLH